MSLSVSSWFVDQMNSAVSQPLRYFTVGGSDYSKSVLRWPRIIYRADNIDLGTISIGVSNREREFQFFVDCTFFLTTSCSISLGYTHPLSGTEIISLYMGEPSGVTFAEGGLSARIQLQGKTKRLKDITVGADTTSGGVDFSNSGHYPSDLAWYLLTDYGQMSVLQHTSNPDIDWNRWLAWRDLDIIKDVRVKGYFTGQKVYQALNTLAYMDSMVLYFRNEMLDFTPSIKPADIVEHNFVPREIIDLKLTLDPTKIINEFTAEADYNVETGVFGNYTILAHSQSQVDYGKRSGRFGSTFTWFETLNDGRYLAEDRVRFHYNTKPLINLKTTLAGGGHLTVGDVVTLSESSFQLSGKPLRVTEMAMDLGQGTIDFKLERAHQRAWHFVEKVSSKNMMVRTITQVGEDQYLAISEGVYGKEVYRKSPGEMFTPLSSYASALLAINDNEIIFGGPPTSGYGQSVVRRSSDSGSSSTTVSSLNPSASTVHDFHRLQSGTLLASTTSGGIWRSSDAGSSWALTWTISGAYNIHRFFTPSSGKVWGGTGYDSPLSTNGAYIWESTNDGVSWSLKHTVISSGDYNIQGFYRISDTEFLLSTYGSGYQQRDVYRSTYTSPDSISWWVVLPKVGFSDALLTDSGHILFGFNEKLTATGGSTYRSMDAGSSWLQDSRVSKQGNIRLLDNGDGTFEAFSSRLSAAERTDRHRNYDPDNID